MKPRTPEEIQAMREGGHMLATVLDLLSRHITAGIPTIELDVLARRELTRLGAKPAFLGYHDFPGVLCVSVNDEVVHGIPRKDRVLESGDIVGLDFGVLHKGMITDGAISVIVGKSPQPQHQTLVNITKQSLEKGIAAVKHGAHVGDISAAIQGVLDKHGFGVVRDLVGHGVGHELHEEPNIPNYGSRGEGPMLKAGMTIAIEPMATLGSYEVYVAPDDWTVVTKDHSLAAHFEHTVLVTEDGAEILTLI